MAIFRIGKFSGQQRNDQDSLFPFGVEPKLAPQVFPVLFKDMKSSYLALILREIRDSKTSILLMTYCNI